MLTVKENKTNHFPQYKKYLLKDTIKKKKSKPQTWRKILARQLIKHWHLKYIKNPYNSIIKSVLIQNWTKKKQKTQILNKKWHTNGQLRYEKDSASFTIRETQIKIVRYHNILTRVAKIKENDIPSVDKIVEQLELINTAHMNSKWYSHFGKAVCLFLMRWNILLPYNPAVPLLCVYPRDIKALCLQKGLHLDVHSSFNHYSPKLETAQVAIITRMNKETVVSIQWNTTQQYKGKHYRYFQQHRQISKIPWVKAAYMKGCILYASFYMNF